MTDTFREYEFGQPARFIALFSSTATGLPANPTVTIFKLALIIANPPPDPTGLDAQFGVSSAVTNPATGRFEFVFAPTLPGNYIVRVVGTGAVQGAAVARFRVLPNPLA